jgi:hypothetical protein
MSRSGILVVLALAAAPAAAQATLDPRLAPLAFLVGKTWRADFPGSTPEKPVTDVSRFEAALNGRAVRSLHSINDGEYGGESLIFWDSEQGSIAFHYFTTAGFYTEGTMTPEGEGVATHEVVHGNAGGVTEVKATFRLLPDGRMHVQARELKDGAWGAPRDVYYVATPGAVVRFKE